LKLIGHQVLLPQQQDPSFPSTERRNPGDKAGENLDMTDAQKMSPWGLNNIQPMVLNELEEIILEYIPYG